MGGQSGHVMHSRYGKEMLQRLASYLVLWWGKSNSSRGLQIKASKTYLQVQLQKIEARNWHSTPVGLSKWASIPSWASSVSCIQMDSPPSSSRHPSRRHPRGSASAVAIAKDPPATLAAVSLPRSPTTTSLPLSPPLANRVKEVV
jgi:hypothetical protein